MAKIYVYDEAGNSINQLTQWDLNRLIKIKDYPYNTAPIFHFCNRSDEKSIVQTDVALDTATKEVTVKIPNELLQKTNMVIGYVYRYDAEKDMGETVYTFELPVQKKPKPNDYVYVDNVEIVEISTLSVALQEAIAQAESSVSSEIERLETAFDTKSAEIDSQFQAATDELNADITSALNTLLNGIKDGTPKGIFTSASGSDLSGKEAGIYLYKNDGDAHNGYIYYWDGTSLSDPILLYNALEIGENQITYDMLSDSLKHMAVEDEHIFDSQQELDEFLASEYVEAGQIVKVLVDSKYKVFIVQEGTDSTLSLSSINAESFVGDSLPSLEDADADTDYYILQGGSYVHYRLIEGNFVAVGGDSYSKSQIDNKFNRVTDLEKDMTTVKSDVSTLKLDVINLKENPARTYYATYGGNRMVEDIPDEDAANTFVLYETDGENDNPVSKFVIRGGTGSSSAAQSVLTFNAITSMRQTLVAVNGEDINIDFTAVSVDNGGQEIGLSYTVQVGNKVVSRGELYEAENNQYSFNVAPYCSLGTQDIRITVKDANGVSDWKKWKVQVVDFRVEADIDDCSVFQVGNEAIIPIKYYGATSKTIVFSVDGEVVSRVTNSDSGGTHNFRMSPTTHGAHMVECHIEAKINNIDKISKSVYIDTIWVDADSDAPIIASKYRDADLQFNQYDTFNLSYYVYDPRNSVPEVEHIVKIGDNEPEVVDTANVQDNRNTWSIRNTDYGDKQFTVRCGSESLVVNAHITKLDIDVSPITEGIQFDFNPIGLSNSSDNRLWKEKTNPDIKLTVSDNFDWDNGGYVIDESGNTCFCVKAGSRATISHKLFGRDLKNGGSEFKLVFKTSNVSSADATFLRCVNLETIDREYERLDENDNPVLDENDEPIIDIVQEEMNVGLEMAVHEAHIRGGYGDLYVPYSEEDIIEFEYNIENIGSKKNALIMTYEDGVSYRPMNFRNGSKFKQDTPQDIVIGSDNCDIYIYRMKSYGNNLSDNDILKNFISDSLSTEDLIARYRRNQIYNEDKQLTPESVADACPNLRVIKIECPWFTTGKKDFVAHSIFQQIFRNGDPVKDNWMFVDAYIAGQGTTSDKYGYAGRNMTLVGCANEDYRNKNINSGNKVEGYSTTLYTGVDDNGERLYEGDVYDPVYLGEVIESGEGKIQINEDSVPNNIFNIKVNIASSENTNNALLAKMYNQFLPYKSPAQKRDSRVKNTMEFVPCAIFIRETDEQTEMRNGVETYINHKEFNDTNWHFYGIGNFGDHKDSDFTRVNDANDVNEFVVEIGDNTYPNAVFPTGIENNGEIIYPISESQWVAGNPAYDNLYDNWDGTYEFRYIHKNADKNACKQKWRDFYKWVVTSSDSDFVAHLGDWFIESSALYFYLHTERYTMTDNRAKNTFWHWSKIYITEEEAVGMGSDAANYTINNDLAAINDGYRFDFWDYDNDTSLGINNSGELKMPYGKEDIDLTEDGVYVFNAANSVFFMRIRNLMFPQLVQMYNSVGNAGGWKSGVLINEFDKWQETIPEELWRLNYEREYVRTYYGSSIDNSIQKGADTLFMETMMNGRKKYHRRQFERNQCVYMATKYGYTGYSTIDDMMYVRAHTLAPESSVAPSWTVNITPYIDMYINVDYGASGVGGAGFTRTRAKAGQTYEIQCPFAMPNTDTSDGTMIVFYGASRLKSLGDLSALYVDTNSFRGGEKISEIIIGNSQAGYSNPYLKRLSLGNNKLLKTIDITNCKNINDDLDLSECINLENLHARNSKLSGVTFATNGNLKNAYLPSTVSSLVLRKLDKLENLQVTYSSINNLIIDGGAIDSKDFISRLNLNKANISIDVAGINWTMTDTPTESDGVDIYAPSILVEKLYNKALDTVSEDNRNGTIFLRGTINVGEIRQKHIDKYQSWWDVLIRYGNYIRQSKIDFLNADLTPIRDSRGNVYAQWVDATSPFEIKSYEPIQAGDITVPTIPSTEQYTFTFDHWAAYVNGEVSDEEYVFDRTLRNDATLVAVYTSNIRTYTVNWYKDENKSILLHSEEVEYGTYADYNLPAESIKEVLHHTFGNSTKDEYRMFIGWDKSTGFVRQNIDICGKWDTTGILDVDENGKYEIVNETGDLKTKLSEMTEVEIFAISESGQWEDFFSERQGDYIDILMGSDFSFDNVEEKTIVDVNNTLILNGDNAFIATDKNGNPIKLFGVNSPSFTLVVDFGLRKNGSSTPPENSMIVSCAENLDAGNDGFALRNTVDSNNNVWGNILWGDKSRRVSTYYQRDICVIRHRTGENDLHIYSFNGNPPSVQNVANASEVTAPNINCEYYFTDTDVVGHYKYIDGEFVKIGDDPVSNGRVRTAVQSGEYYENISVYKLSRNISTTPSSTDGIPLIIGGIAEYNETISDYVVSENNKGYANIFWCKIWFDDLGDSVARKLASFTRNYIRPQYFHAATSSTGNKHGCPYYIDKDSGVRANASFVCNSQLPLNHVMNISNVNAGGWRSSLMRTFCNNRVFNGMPEKWQNLIKTVQVVSLSTSGTDVTSDKVYLGSYGEYAQSVNSEMYNLDGRIPWLTTVDSRLTWKNLFVNWDKQSPSYSFNPSVLAPQAKYTGAANPIIDNDRGVYDPINNPDGVKEGEIWKTNANNTSQTGYMWVTNETYAKYKFTGGTPFIDDDENTLGYWMGSANYWLRSPSTGYSTTFWYVFSPGYVGSYGASYAYGVVPCFSI